MNDFFSLNLEQNFYIILTGLLSVILFFTMSFKLGKTLYLFIKMIFVLIFCYTLYNNYVITEQLTDYEKIYSYVLSGSLLTLIAFIVVN